MIVYHSKSVVYDVFNAYVLVCTVLDLIALLYFRYQEILGQPLCKA